MKRQTVFIIGLLLIVAGLFVLSADKYATEPKPVDAQQAVAQRDNALKNLEIQKSINEVDRQAADKKLATQKAATDAATAKNATLCAQIKAAKLQQPLCQ